MSLTLPDGRTVILGERTPGGSKNDTRFARLSDGQQVVVKIQAHYGQLDTEEATLQFLAPTPVRVPGVIGSGTTSDGRHFLVITREDGARAKDPDGWRRFGRDLAALTRVPVDHGPQEVVPASVFAAEHRQRLAVVAPIIDRGLADRIATAIDRVAPSDRLALTHGDPGSGNYLDNGDVGVILDWETASVSPFGLDAGRAAFIGLMDHAGTGRPAELYAAFVAGYRAALQDPAALDNDLLTAWVIVAGLQFIHGRLTQPLRPERTPQVAADVLQRFLTSS